MARTGRPRIKGGSKKTMALRAQWRKASAKYRATGGKRGRRRRRG